MKHHLPLFGAAAAIAVVGIVVFDLPLSSLWFVALVLVCPLVMMVMMRGMHGGGDGGSAGGHGHIGAEGRPDEPDVHGAGRDHEHGSRSLGS